MLNAVWSVGAVERGNIFVPPGAKGLDQAWGPPSFLVNVYREGLLRR